MADVKIMVIDNGPYKVSGKVTLVSDNGTSLVVEEGEPIFLCRCGESEEKPFCDGTHKSCGFVNSVNPA